MWLKGGMKSRIKDELSPCDSGLMEYQLGCFWSPQTSTAGAVAGMVIHRPGSGCKVLKGDKPQRTGDRLSFFEMD